MKEVTIRAANRDDCQAIRQLIQELAVFEKMPDGPQIEYKDLQRDGFDLENPLFYSYVATVEGKIIGYAFYHYSYSTWNGKSMFLQDIYVTPSYQKKKIGNKLFDAVVKKAVETNCGRIDFEVLNWNPAKEFYENRGCINITQKEGWQCYRLEHTAMEKLIAE